MRRESELEKAFGEIVAGAITYALGLVLVIFGVIAVSVATKVVIWVFDAITGNMI